MKSGCDNEQCTPNMLLPCGQGQQKQKPFFVVLPEPICNIQRIGHSLSWAVPSKPFFSVSISNQRLCAEKFMKDSTSLKTGMEPIVLSFVVVCQGRDNSKLREGDGGITDVLA